MLHRDTRNAAVAEAEAAAHFRKRLRDRIIRGMDETRSVLERIEQTGRALEDIVVPFGGADGRLRFEYGTAANPNSVVAIVGQNSGARTFTLSKHATEQACEKLGVHAGFAKKLIHGRPWQRQLIANVLDAHVQHSARDKVLLRAVGSEARAVLSTSYKRLDSALISARFIQAALESNAAIYRAEADDTRFRIECVLPEVFTVDAGPNGLEYISVGAVYSTSDFGDGADSVQAFIERCWCTNKAVSNSMLRTVHLGRRTEGLEIQWSRATLLRDSEAQASAVYDTVTQALSADRVRALLEAVPRAAGTALKLDDEVKTLEKAGMTDGELEALTELLSQNDPERVPGGALTPWRLGQAISAVSAQAKPRRAVELQELAGRVIGINKAN